MFHFAIVHQLIWCSSRFLSHLIHAMLSAKYCAWLYSQSSVAFATADSPLYATLSGVVG
jgi:hypothetical protein